MKITYLSSSTIPSRTANSIHVMKMCQAFARNGHEVVLVAPNKKNDIEPGVEDVFDFYGVEKCFEIANLPWLPVKGWVCIYGLLAGRRAKAFKPDLVYCRNTVGCFFAARFGLPVIFESHTPIEEENKISVWMFGQLIKSPRLQKLVVITRALKEYYESTYPQTKGKILVAPDGADPVPEGIVPVELPNKGKRLQVGYVGHLYKGKGMEVVSKLATLCSWADFHVVGGKEGDLEYWKKECRNCANIFFHGYVPHGQTVRHIQAFDVVLLPNQQKVAVHGGGGNIGQWTSPLKAFEYMAAAKAIICSDLPVLREVLEHERNVLLCPPDDVSTWQKALHRLRDDQILRQRLGSAAYEDFLANYTWQARARLEVQE
jgi:glycosyltransferase involved in cell wall biosynthesis